jgi:hypothetical protein
MSAVSFGSLLGGIAAKATAQPVRDLAFNL